MPLSGEYAPSTARRAREHAETYENSNGTKDTTSGGLPVVVVTSVGAKSGKLRKTPVMRVEHEGRYVLVASYGGKPNNPAWYHNVVANPRVDVRDGSTVHEMVARPLSGDEYERWWDYAVATFPHYATYRERAPRPIPLFLLEPA